MDDRIDKSLTRSFSGNSSIGNIRKELSQGFS